MRPSKSAKILSDYSQTKAEIKARAQEEERLKSDTPPCAPQWLSDSQREIFDRIVACLKDSEMLCANDNWLLEQTAVAIDRLQTIEEKINADSELMFDRGIIAARSGYTRDFYRGCNELCLSPQSRAKLANIASGKEKMKPIEQIIAQANED